MKVAFDMNWQCLSGRCTIQYNTTSFISNIEHNYIITTMFTQHWDGWKGGGQKSNLIVVHPQHPCNDVLRKYTCIIEAQADALL